jgi:hypothetical protein
MTAARDRVEETCGPGHRRFARVRGAPKAARRIARGSQQRQRPRPSAFSGFLYSSRMVSRLSMTAGATLRESRGNYGALGPWPMGHRAIVHAPMGYGPLMDGLQAAQAEMKCGVRRCVPGPSRRHSLEMACVVKLGGGRADGQVFIDPVDALRGVRRNAWRSREASRAFATTGVRQEQTTAPPDPLGARGLSARSAQHLDHVRRACGLLVLASGSPHDVKHGRPEARKAARAARPWGCGPGPLLRQ